MARISSESVLTPRNVSERHRLFSSPVQWFKTKMGNSDPVTAEQQAEALINRLPTVSSMNTDHLREVVNKHLLHDVMKLLHRHGVNKALARKMAPTCQASAWPASLRSSWLRNHGTGTTITAAENERADTLLNNQLRNLVARFLGSVCDSPDDSKGKIWYDVLVLRGSDNPSQTLMCNSQTIVLLLEQCPEEGPDAMPNFKHVRVQIPCEKENQAAADTAADKSTQRRRSRKSLDRKRGAKRRLSV
eukprot:CAMPEP_0114555856 /NCGR_PEP_ID=MMETSP0114-20121206/8973_1 /TAXON_ID=31324 /ORGANISM="Goniomonas sp, Strain m" /LENGTH=245 /DNA_ID=CAMNT_0001741011 /DNA_START=41 /DNA_END=778 /DNA_ORIENTATION=-